eukprot:TRINITY_DN20123_c0_g1_i1.p1 TRINITY_DN20123_c0_g1~~TRINITY_DN20123_c0_g1_i1.p1  ORF type:complete len:103 (+),score=24.39 TRINITY_DN20123_c0_g1_i1:271-579(+)
MYDVEVVDESLAFFHNQHHAEHFREFRKSMLDVTSSAAASSMGLFDGGDGEDGGALGSLIGNFNSVSYTHPTLADDLLCVDLGGCRIIKKKNVQQHLYDRYL